MKAYIYAGGQILADNIGDAPKPEDLCLAADGGYENARALGARVDIWIGDGDSSGSVSIPSGIERIVLPCEKDETDTQAAVRVALSRGCREIVIIGGMGTRLDHTLSTIGILEGLHAVGVPVYAVNGYNRVHYLKEDSLLVPRSRYRYLSLLAADACCRGVSLAGCRYPLHRAKLRRGLQYAVSNEITENMALVTVRRGGLYVIESCDG